MTFQELLQASTPVQGYGPLDAKVWLVGEAPTEEEVAQQKPFQGNSGKVLRQGLRNAGFQESEVRFENLCDVRPPKNDFNYFEDCAEAKAYLEGTIKALVERIRGAKPNLVILLGAKPLQYLAGVRGIGEWRGHITYSQTLACKVMATFHPGMCIRQRYVDNKKKEYPGQYDALFGADLTKAKANSTTAEMPEQDYQTHIEPTFEEATQYLFRAMREAKWVSFDIETQGKDLMDCIGFSTNLHESMCIPFYITGYGELMRYWKNEEQMATILGMVKQLLESDIPKIAQNGQFDRAFLARNYAIMVRNIIHDTLVAGHDLYCELPKDLGTLISLYTNLPYHKYMIHSGSHRDRWIYNALDALSTAHVWQGQQKEMESLGIRQHYYRIPNMAIIPCNEMQLAGIKVDLKIHEWVIKREKAIVDDLTKCFEELFPKGFNPNSIVDKKWLFYDVFQLKTQWFKNKPTTNEDAMEVWTNDPRPYVAILAEACLRFSHARTQYSQFKSPLDNGRIHSSFDVAGTDTGRLSSSKTFWGTGKNLQNRTVGVQRQELIPDDMEEYCIVDLWAAEAYTTFLEAGETLGLKMLDQGIKIHNWMWDQTKKKFPELLPASAKSDTGYNYKAAKQTIHSSNYGVEPPKMAQESGLPLAVCEWQKALYHGTFPGVRSRQLRIEEQLQKNRTLVSLLGRKRVFFAPFSNHLLNQAYAWPSQSVIGELTVLAMSKLYYQGLVNPHLGLPWVFPAMNTHDGLAIRCKLGQRAEVKKVVASCFRIPLTKGSVTTVVPIEMGWGLNANDVKDKEVIR